MKETLIGNRYLLLEPIGSGGEARVFRARDEVTQNEFALRLLPQTGACACPRDLPVAHPHWVRIFSWGNDSQHGAYQVMELLRGQTLDQIVQAGPCETAAWIEFVQQSLDAVGALHHAGFIHGDLNAGNFLFTAEGWKLLELPFFDFERPKNRSSLFGSIYTLTPEHLDSRPLDARSDLYALGCLYYYAASGQYPHAASSNREIAINRLCFSPTPLHEIAPLLSSARNAWVMTLLQRKPEDRFPSVSEARRLFPAG
ncbi:MAG TPA: serine/threonine-protein kinase [Candidatus Methylacidiphilales bacterium]|nr:serine/threonine-protein kinase [Candidatus Methylacidiphilales bacterium]